MGDTLHLLASSLTLMQLRPLTTRAVGWSAPLYPGAESRSAVARGSADFGHQRWGHFRHATFSTNDFTDSSGSQRLTNGPTWRGAMPKCKAPCLSITYSSPFLISTE